MNRYRKLQRIIPAQPSADGDGVRIKRIAGRDVQRQMDPFLMLDEIRSDDSADYIGGFPAHPHRGFETITYLLDGKMRHSDHLGNHGLLESGGVQWMLAGRGVIHSEMPEQDNGLLHGFQLWLNLPAVDKMQPARYQDFPRESFPATELPSGAAIRVLAGSPALGAGHLAGPLRRPVTEPVIMDVTLESGAEFEWHSGGSATVLVYVYEGGLRDLQAGQMGVYAEGEVLQLAALAPGARLLVISGQPLREPIAQYGPFVMNSVEEIERAIADYNSGQLVAQ